eukprot:TRINITY_DN5769_c0_g1_i1.p1 TRINITY_DN5769_c0_g1~~TRINITY_DN5769_c0_g1_i1.p1  ORF type:complete len:436 (+),score=94.33 TRINITY_DN5769_c0_g1_i1:85-1392(+)
MEISSLSSLALLSLFFLIMSVFGDKYNVWWHAPFFTGSGYGSEAIEYVEALQQSDIKVKISQHGDIFNHDFVDGLPLPLKLMLRDQYFTHMEAEESIVICHSEPGAWDPPLFETSLCPPPNAMYKIGRTMFETDRIPEGWVERLDKMDEIWVPSHFNKEIFITAGVNPHKIHVVPESVNTSLFDPKAVRDLPRIPRSLKLCHALLKEKGLDPSEYFIFLSIFKWEHRKGWNILLESFIKEFTKDDKVALCLRTKPPIKEEAEGMFANMFGSKERLARESFQQILAQVQEAAGINENESPHIVLIAEDIPANVYPRIYLEADAFVLPSRGEGWGRPHAEAMAMGLPVIATNWSGTTEFLNEKTGYPIPVTGLESVGEGSFRDHMHAKIDQAEFRKLMRYVVKHPVRLSCLLSLSSFLHHSLLHNLSNMITKDKANL